MGSHCQTVAWSRSDECQNLEAVNSFWGKKVVGQLQSKSVTGAVAYKLCCIPSILCNTLFFGKESCVEDFGSFL